MSCMTCWQGHGQQSSLPLGHLPNVTSFVRRHVLELTPAVLRDILSLRALQVQAEPGHFAVPPPELVTCSWQS